MSRPPYGGQIGRTEIVRVPGWAVSIGAIFAGALGIAVFLASASLILMLAPVIVAAVFYIRWRVRRAFRQMAEDQRAYQGDARKTEHMDIIDGEYRIIDDEQDRNRR